MNRLPLFLIAILPLTTLAQDSAPAQSADRPRDPERFRMRDRGGDRDARTDSTDATTRPNWRMFRDGRPGGGFGGGPGFGGGWRGFGAPPPATNPDLPTDDQWSEVAAYMQRDLPHSWDRYQSAPETRKDDLKRLIYARFRETQNLRERGELELYALKLEQAKLTDAAEGLVRDWRKAEPADKPAVRAKLREKVRDLALTTMKERDLRIRRLERQLAAEREKLANEQETLDSNLDRRVDSLIARVRRESAAAAPTNPDSPAPERTASAP